MERESTMLSKKHSNGTKQVKPTAQDEFVNFVKPYCAYRFVTRFMLRESYFINFSGMLTV
jgi:hypothetical protein